MRRFRLSLILCLALVLGACGFHLRGALELPYRTLFIEMPDDSGLSSSLKRQIRYTDHTRVVDDKSQADGVLVVMFDRREKVILSTNAQGRVAEYQLRRNFGFRVTNAQGQQIVPLSEIVLVRDMTYNDNYVSAKGMEEQKLWEDIESDLLQQLMRRLSAMKPVAPEEP
jgi:LPS-assembly lipoprotein